MGKILNYSYVKNIELLNKSISNGASLDKKAAAPSSGTCGLFRRVTGLP